jgi:hypothetical protein
LRSIEEDSLSLRGKKRLPREENQVRACGMSISSLKCRYIVDREKRSLLSELVDAGLMSIVRLMFETTIESEP